nr:hypothetical protein [Bacillaceae bacterium]
MILPAAAESLSDFCANFPSAAKSRPPGVKFPENRRIDGPPFILPAVFWGRARALQVVSMV